VDKHPDAPIISHEIGQWCVYPNFDEIRKYTGHFKARNFEIFRETARRNGVLGQAREFLMASGKWQAACYKHDIEAALRTPRLGGFQLLDLHDFPGQGTALVGVLGAFWDEKGYISAEEYSRFCGPVVPLARYPDKVPLDVPVGLIRTDALDDTALAALDAGAAVFLSIPPDRVAPDPRRGRIALGFSSIFWNTAWTNQQAPHTLGILCDPAHPALAGFPTEAHSNWQWWYPVMRASAMILDGLPHELRPIVQVVDDWFTNRKLGLVFEARVGRGRLLVSSIDLDGADDPVSRQLLASLLDYAAGDAFVPGVDVAPSALRQLFAP
jgi:hypothetical protein